MTGLDLDSITAEFLQQCGPCDFGVDSAGCNCPKRDYRNTMSALVDEVRRLRGEAEHLRVQLATVKAGARRMATDPGQ